MRKEKKGIVSKAVESFTKPAVPPNLHTPFKQPISRAVLTTPGSTNSRRTSARMGVATTGNQSAFNLKGFNSYLLLRIYCPQHVKKHQRHSFVNIIHL